MVGVQKKNQYIESVMQSKFHLYIHAPWCKRHCPYCDFTVYTDKSPPFEQWKQKILQDWSWHQQHLFISDAPHTIYFGGGTPSLVPPRLLQEIITQISSQKTTEITVEVNPGDVNPQRLQQYREMNINRLSLGVQTFNRHHLRRLGRASTPSDANQLIQWVQEARFPSWSMDLMFGLPDQTLNELVTDLDTLLHFEPPHLSIYGLTYKPNTPFHRALQSGQLQDIDEDLWIEMFETIASRMKTAGYLRYEVSNFCKPPHVAHHNEGIWRNESYIGLGPGAHGFWPNKSRTRYDSIWETWLDQSAPYLESSTPEQQAIDWLLTAIRHHEGIHIPTLEHIGFTLQQSDPRFRSIRPYLIIESNRIRLASSGWIVVNWITDKILDIMQPINKDKP